MAGFFVEDKPRGYTLIAAELYQAKAQLKDRQGELVKAERHVADVKDTCARLSAKIAELEHDQRALDRGYIALMSERAAHT
jgi:septal ring factor EnvC (AmiA/AmiB activator)